MTDDLTEQDAVGFAYTVANKVRKNERAMTQYRTNRCEQVMLGDFPKAVNDAVIGSSEAQRNQMMQLLSDPDKARNFTRLIYDLIEIGVVALFIPARFARLNCAILFRIDPSTEPPVSAKFPSCQVQAQ